MSYIQDNALSDFKRSLRLGQFPLKMSNKEAEIKKKERAIQFSKFLRTHEARVVPNDNPSLILALLHQPKPFKLREGNLLETFGCNPGPGIRENAKLILQNTFNR